MSRLARDAAAVFMSVGLIAGTLFWSDDAWPFAQMRMFPKGTRGAVWVLALNADFSDGRRGVRLGFENFHLRRAEVEGQVARVQAHPELLGDLIRVYNRGAPADRRIVRLYLLSRKAPLSEGRLQPGPRAAGRRARAAPPPGIRWVVTEVAHWPPR